MVLFFIAFVLINYYKSNALHRINKYTLAKSCMNAFYYFVNKGSSLYHFRHSTLTHNKLECRSCLPSSSRNSILTYIYPFPIHEGHISWLCEGLTNLSHSSHHASRVITLVQNNNELWNRNGCHLVTQFPCNPNNRLILR